jgi:membrane-associated protease RseP (regulator of RpoE activity)
MFEAEEKVEVIDKNTGQWLKTIWRAKFGAPNHAFDTYVYNRTALEVLADDICRNEMGLRYLDWATFWNMTAILSLILAFMNFLPIPGLDGGYILFLLFEIITRRQPSDKFLERANMFGWIILIALLIFANGNDLLKWLFM